MLGMSYPSITLTTTFFFLIPMKAVWKEFLKIKTHLHLTAYNSWAEWVNLLLFWGIRSLYNARLLLMFAYFKPKAVAGG